MKRYKYPFKLLIALFSLLLISCNSDSLKKKTNNDTKKEIPQVAVLGMLHFVSKNNTVSQEFTEVSSDKRQKEIKSLIKSLKKFQPTKIAVERPYRSDKELNKKYNEYLNDTYELTEEETDQIAFRLAKELKHDRLYLAYSPVTYAFEETVAFAKDNDQYQLIDSIVSNAKELAKEYDIIAQNKTIKDAIHYLNTQGAIDKNHYGYQLLSQIGNKESQIGANAVGDWYKSNIKIFENIRKIATSKTDRILVIYGQGHCKIINQLIDDSPELELIKINEYIK